MLPDCIRRYMLYKAACVDDVQPMKTADVKDLDAESAEQLYKHLVHQWLDAKDCLEGRRWVKKNCYDNNEDVGHDKAIKIAEENLGSLNQNLHIVSDHLTSLRTLKSLDNTSSLSSLNNLAANNAASASAVATSSKSKGKRKKKKKNKSKDNTSSLVLDADNEDWYKKILSKKEEEEKAQRKDFEFLQNLVVRNLKRLKKDSPVAEWLFKSMKRSMYISIDVISFMQEKFEAIGDADKKMTLLDNEVANYLENQVIPRSEYKFNSQLNAQQDAFVNHCFTRLYNCSPDEVTHVLHLDTPIVSIWTRLLTTCHLYKLSSTKINESRCRISGVSADEREIIMRGFVALAQWLHPSHDAAYIRSHLHWEKINIHNIRAGMNLSGEPDSKVDDDKTILNLMLLDLKLYMTHIADA